MLKLEKYQIYELEIEMSTLCNAECPLCYRNYKSFPLKYKQPFIRKLNDIIEQLDTYENLNFVMLVGSMSEPTLYPFLFDLIKYLKTRNITIELCTNGDTHDEKWWKDLAKILMLNDKVYFTICGSTQELHEKYRKNTKLKNILNNARAFRSVIDIDYAQCIQFNYNTDDFDSIEFKNMISEFNNVYLTETFYPKDLSNYRIHFNHNDFLPNRHKLKRYQLIKSLAESQFSKNNKKYDILCQSIEHKRQQIDVYGNIYPCYLYLEYSDSKIWNQDYSKILNMHDECCKFCSKNILNICRKNRLDYIV